MGDILVVGGGVSGSTLAYATAKEGFKVVVYDNLKNYLKACGDAVTVRELSRRLVKQTGSMLTEVKHFDIMVNGELVATVSFGSAPWIIVDKPKLVSGLREMAESEGALFEWRREGLTRRGFGIVVDARGPYAWPPKYSVLAYRVLGRGDWDPNRALIDFRTRERGLYWVFPVDDEGRRFNAGAGFKDISDGNALKELIYTYLRDRLRIGPTKLEGRGAPIQIYAPLRLRENRVLKVGEAAGLIVRTAGEGNRPGMESGIALARAISSRWTGSPEDAFSVESRYANEASRLIDEVKTSRILLGIVERAGAVGGSEILRSLPKSFWHHYIRAGVGRGYVAKLMLLTPRLTWRIATSLLSSPAWRVRR